MSSEKILNIDVMEVVAEHYFLVLIQTPLSPNIFLFRFILINSDICPMFANNICLKSPNNSAWWTWMGGVGL